MTDGHPTDRRDHHVFLDAMEGLRSDVREDIGQLRDDMREDNERLEGRIMTVVTGFQTAHGAVHDSDKAANDLVHATFTAFIRNAELAQARRDGALGVFRFAIEVVSRNWKPITVVLTAATAVLFAATGDLRIEIVSR